METETIDIDLNGNAWQLQINPWPYKSGQRWLIRFVKILGELAFNKGTNVTVDELLSRVSDTVLAEFVDECERQTVCVGPERKAVAFEKITPLLRARYDITLRLAATHLRVTFGPFFASLGTVMGDLAGEANREAVGT